ncbi:MAG: MFS transporter [Bdellovibrionales bacterium]
MTRNIRLIALHNFLVFFRPQWAFLAIYCAQVTGSYTIGMAAMATHRIVGAIADIPTGILSDKIGRKYTLVLGSALLLLATSCFAFATGAIEMFAGAILIGLAESMFSGNNDALLYEDLQEHQKTAMLTRHQSHSDSLVQLGLGLSALLSTLFVQDGLKLVFAIGIFPHALALLTSLFFANKRLPKEHHPHGRWQNFKESLRYVLRNKRLSLLMAGNALGSGAAEAHFAFITVFIQQLWPTWGLGFYRAAHHLMAFSGFLFVHRLLSRIKPILAVISIRIYVPVSCSLALLFANALSPLFYLSNGLTYGTTSVGVKSLMQQEFTDKQRATLGSVASFATKFVYGATNMVMGILADHFGIRVAAAFAIGLGVLSLPVYLKVFRKYL